jgi:carboxyl-terminal processing protease
MNLTDAVKLIRGKKGTSVTLTFYREGKGTIEKTIVRDTITMPSVELITGDWKNGNWGKSDLGSVAWLRVYRFGENTQEQWDAAVEKIIANRSAIKGIVLDVRNNPGGLLQTAINLASDFIPEGTVVTQQGRLSTETYTVSRRARMMGIPMTVLINGGSASASEILAGALRDRLGVQLVGEKSFGKGTVQEALDLTGGAGLHVTIAKWLLPNGDWIHEKGLTPAVEVKLPDTASDSASTVDTQLESAIKALPTK